MPKRAANGYRPTKACEIEVKRLRARLELCRKQDWQRASCIMSQIVELVGSKSAGGVEPRLCKYCGFHGHTVQWCKAYKAELAERERRDAELQVSDYERWRQTQPWYSVHVTPEATAQYEFAWRRYEAACAAGLECLAEDQSRGPCLQCAGCVAWREFIETYSEST